MLGATFIWGSVPLMGIWSGLPSAIFVFFRVLFALPFIFFFVLKHISLKEFFKVKPFWPLLLSGIMLGVNWVFFFWAIKVIDVATVVTIYYAGPIISILLASIFLNEKVDFFVVLSVVLAFIGIFISSGSLTFSKGILIAFLAALSYGLLGFFSKIATFYHKATVITGWQILISVFITFPFLFLGKWGLSFKSLIVVIVAGVVHTALALFLWYDALSYISVSLASILQYLDIVFATILAYLFLNQIPVPAVNQIIEALLIVISGSLISLKEMKGTVVRLGRNTR
ncbi:rarD protein [Desulfurobacterium atlanticum]|uniref:RarD protein n=2 Tax=Desulfurobacterium atlanticum TaxID=240169 RepID=A0A238Y3W5_9BACT|nr:rarD protein [Desulfurobacterium atlanticum]